MSTKDFFLGILFGILIVLLGFFGYDYVSKSQLNQISNSSGEVLSGIVETGIIGMGTGAASGETLTDTGISEQEVNVGVGGIIRIDDAITNCTEKKKKGRTITGLGGASTMYSTCKDGTIGKQEWLLAPWEQDKKAEGSLRPICSVVVDGEKQDIYPLTKEDISSEGYKIVKDIKLQGKLDSVYIASNANRYDQNYCAMGNEGGDKNDCEMAFANPWVDGKNTIVVGQRTDKLGELMFLANGKLFSQEQPLKNHIGSFGVDETNKGPFMSNRNYVKIENDKLIVRRLKDYKFDTSRKNQYGDYAASFSVETCEIDIK